MSVFVVIWFLLFFWIIAKMIAQFIRNENSPVLTVSATIADMRRKIHHHHNNGHHHLSHSYHVTFRTQEGEALELRVNRRAYHELTVGKCGMLTHQGTRYLGFDPLSP